MPRVTVSSKRQITLPAEIVRRLGIEAGDKLAVELIGDRIIVIPEPESWVDYFAGSMKGVYGDTKAEIDRYVAEERASWDSSTDENRTEWRERFADLYCTDEELRSVVDALRKSLYHTARQGDLEQRAPRGAASRTDRHGRRATMVGAVLDLLVGEGWVRRIPMMDASGEQRDVRYRLVGEVAESLPSEA